MTPLEMAWELLRLDSLFQADDVGDESWQRYKQFATTCAPVIAAELVRLAEEKP